MPDAHPYCVMTDVLELATHFTITIGIEAFATGQIRC